MNSPRRAHAHARPARRTQAKAGARGGNVRFRAFDSRPADEFVLQEFTGRERDRFQIRLAKRSADLLLADKNLQHTGNGKAQHVAQSIASA